MLIRRAILDGVVDGEIDLAFRRWDRPSVKPGTRQRTPVGIIEITAIEQIALEDITDQEAVRAGATSAGEIRAWLAERTGSVYRIGLAYGGPDPRVALRQTAITTHEEQASLAAKLARFDESGRRGAWTIAVLEAIEDAPGTPAAELAERFGREKLLSREASIGDRSSRHKWSHFPALAAPRRAARATPPQNRLADIVPITPYLAEALKTDVRKLKELGLTESLRPGYRLSPRGRSFLKRLDEA